MFVFLLAATIDDAALIATARAKLSAERRCVVDPDSTDITVCGLRNADRFRVPFVGYEPGDPRGESVSGERQRLLNRTTPLKELSPFQVGGGLVGVTMSVGGDGKTSARKPAP